MQNAKQKEKMKKKRGSSKVKYRNLRNKKLKKRGKGIIKRTERIITMDTMILIKTST